MEPTRKQNILLNCNSLNLEQLISLVESENITIEEFRNAGLSSEKLNSLELIFASLLSLDQLIQMVEAKRISILDLLEAELEEEKLKGLRLKFCNSLKIEEIVKIIQSRDITLNEFKSAGLNAKLVEAVSESLNKPDLTKNKLDEIQKVLNGSEDIQNIRSNINNDVYTFDELKEAGVNQKIIDSVIYYFKQNDKIDQYLIKDLPPLKDDRTDLIFVGLASSGKSTMLAGISSAAEKLGIRIPETSNNAGSKYQIRLITDFFEGVLPDSTEKGYYNYIPLSFKNQTTGNKHPFNIIEVPGENYKDMNDTGESNDFLKYIQSTNNDKILIFVIDAFEKVTQALVYVNLLNLFKTKGVLEKTRAIYVILNKFDLLAKTRYLNDNRGHEIIAHEYLKDEYSNLLNNFLEARNESKNKFKLKVMPFSIGNVSYKYILKDFDKKYSNTVLEHLIYDSFYISK